MNILKSVSLPITVYQQDIDSEALEDVLSGFFVLNPKFKAGLRTGYADHIFRMACSWAGYTVHKFVNPTTQKAGFVLSPREVAKTEGELKESLKSIDKELRRWVH